MIDLRCFGAKHMKRRQPESGFSPTQVGYPPPILGCSPQAFNNFKRIKVASTFVKGLRMEKAVEFGCSPFSQLPDDIVVQIYNKVMDLKTLCYCQLISKRLGLIVFEADTISFNVPLPIDYENMNHFYGIKIAFRLFSSPDQEEASSGDLDSDPAPAPLLGSDSFLSAIKFIKRFTKLKSMRIQFPSYVNVVPFVDKDGVLMFQWKIELRSRADSLVIQALNSEDVLESEEESSDDESLYDMTLSCLMDAVDRFKKLLDCTFEFPLLEKIFVMDSNESRIVTLNGGEIDRLRDLLHPYGTSVSEHLVYHNGEISDSASE